MIFQLLGVEITFSFTLTSIIIAHDQNITQNYHNMKSPENSCIWANFDRATQRGLQFQRKLFLQGTDKYSDTRHTSKMKHFAKIING